MKADNAAAAPNPHDRSAGKQLTATWHTLCLNNPEYIDFLIRQAHEVMERYAPDGVFMDIVGKGDCVCPRASPRCRRQASTPNGRATVPGTTTRSYRRSNQRDDSSGVRACRSDGAVSRRRAVGCGYRDRLMRQDSDRRLLLHLLYAQPQLRGRGYTMTNGGRLDVEVIEDPVPIRDVRCRVSVDDKPARLYRAADGREIPFEYEDDSVSFTVEEVYIHELVVIEA